MPECGAILAYTGEGCHRPQGHTEYHRGDGGPFGPWVNPPAITPERHRRDISRAVKEAVDAQLPADYSTGSK